MTPDERKSTGNFSHTGDVPRTGPFPRHPYLPKSAESLNALDGASCPSWAWNNAAPGVANSEAALLLRSLPFPRPLPPVYTHATYRAAPELGDRRRRLLHIFTLVLTTYLGLWCVFSDDWQPKGKPPGRDHIFTPARKWWKKTLAELEGGPIQNETATKPVAVAPAAAAPAPK